MGRLTIGALCTALISGSCLMPPVPRGEYRDSTAGRIIHPDDHKEYLEAARRCDTLSAQLEQLQIEAANFEQENLSLRKKHSPAQLMLGIENAIQDSSAELHLHPTLQWNFYSRIRGAMVNYYLRSKGVDVPSSFGLSYGLYDDFLDALTLEALIEQSYTPNLSADALSTSIKESYVIVKKEGGECTGLLLTTTGYFITAHHCSPIESVVFQGRLYNAVGLSYNEGRDVLVGKAFMSDRPIRPFSIKFAPPSKIQKGTPIVVYGTANGNEFLQMGTITIPRLNVPVEIARTQYDVFQTNALGRRGFSGGPIYIEETGELVGISVSVSVQSLGEIKGENLRGARADSILELLKFELERQILKIRERVVP